MKLTFLTMTAALVFLAFQPNMASTTDQTEAPEVTTSCDNACQTIYEECWEKCIAQPGAWQEPSGLTLASRQAEVRMSTTLLVVAVVLCLTIQPMAAATTSAPNTSSCEELCQNEDGTCRTKCYEEAKEFQGHAIAAAFIVVCLTIQPIAATTTSQPASPIATRPTSKDLCNDANKTCRKLCRDEAWTREGFVLSKCNTRCTFDSLRCINKCSSPE
ncbi:hypothetical protein LSAT2_022533 [Lamellibrachia satsuma]|nr:hypothetical protein LSAT2_022533 [Lamellibrachia satsuma]